MSDVYERLVKIKAADVYRGLDLAKMKENVKGLDGKQYEWTGEFRPVQKGEFFRTDSGGFTNAPMYWGDYLPRLIFRPVKKYRWVLESVAKRLPVRGEWFLAGDEMFQAKADFETQTYHIFTREEVTE